MHIYAFGSVCRGEVDSSSDIDLLAVVDKYDSRFDRSTYSIYSYNRISEIWKEGNPFAWHLATESRIIYSSNGEDYIKQLKSPDEYRNCAHDCKKFYSLYCKSVESIHSGGSSLVFELSTIFLAIRNFATCYMLGKEKKFNFSRRSAITMGNNSIKLSDIAFETLERSRILSIRGAGKIIEKNEVNSVLNEIPYIKNWMKNLLAEVELNG